MGTSRDPRSGRASLQIEHLEDRVTPSITASTPLLKVGPTTYAADRVTVLMDPGTSGAGLWSAPFVTRVKALGFDMYSVRLTPGTDPYAAIAYYNAQPGVEVAELDRIVYATRTPNDPDYGALYGPAKIGAEGVWEFHTGNPGFVVGVIDSGVDWSHPDLAANMWRNPGEIAGNGVDDDRNGFIDDIHGWDFADDDNDPMDFDGHGTHVAGTIGAVGNNGVGVAGVNWSTKIMALRFIGFFGGAISDEVAAINYSIMMGAKVTNNSYGGFGTDFSEARAISRSHLAGQIFVTASGNDGINNDFVGNYPTNFVANFDNVVSVAATDQLDQLASFSNYGVGTVTLAAPGVGIYSTFPFGGYGYLDGTSMASPHVAGAVALFWSANPTLSYTQVINKLKSSVDRLPGLAGLVSTGGRLNVAKMFGLDAVPPVVVGAPVGTDVVRVLAPGGGTQLAVAPHPGFLGGIAAAAGDINGDGVADLVTAATLGGHVKAFDGVTGAEIRSFFGFEGYVGPINVGVGDLTGDGIGDIIIAANLNGHVKVFDGATGALTLSELVYQGYAGAIAVAAADTNGDGTNELITAANGGAGVHVKTFGTVFDSFLATGPGSWPEFGVSAVDLDLDGVAELIVSQGPRVRVLSGQTRAVRADFLAFDPRSTNRVTVQAGRYSGDASAELVVISEVQGRSHVKVFDGQDFILADSFFADTR